MVTRTLSARASFTTGFENPKRSANMRHPRNVCLIFRSISGVEIAMFVVVWVTRHWRGGALTSVMLKLPQVPKYFYTGLLIQILILCLKEGRQKRKHPLLNTRDQELDFCCEAGDSLAFDADYVKPPEYTPDSLLFKCS